MPRSPTPGLAASPLCSARPPDVERARRRHIGACGGRQRSTLGHRLVQGSLAIHGWHRVLGPQRLIDDHHQHAYGAHAADRAQLARMPWPAGRAQRPAGLLRLRLRRARHGATRKSARAGRRSDPPSNRSTCTASSSCSRTPRRSPATTCRRRLRTRTTVAPRPRARFVSEVSRLRSATVGAEICRRRLLNGVNIFSMPASVVRQ